MSELAELRKRLTALRGARARLRWQTALAAFGLACLWSLLGVFVLDLVFGLSVPQRLIVICGAGAIIVWAWRRYVAPLLWVRETMWDMALHVEGSAGIQSDLIAALQFESPAATTWGSTHLQQAVIHSVAQRTPDINVFAGWSSDRFYRRATILLASLVLVAGLNLVFPGYLSVFWERLKLGAAHYPTRTAIERIAVNGNVVLLAGASPATTRIPHGRSSELVLRASGETPAAGIILVRAASGTGGQRKVQLTSLSLEERRDRLVRAQKLLDEIENTGSDAPSRLVADLRALLGLDAPSAFEDISEFGLPVERVTKLRELVQHAAEHLSAKNDSTLYVADVGRMLEPIEYQLYLGDAWTEPAQIELTSVPVAAAEWEVIPPGYAGTFPTERTAHQLVVLEGSEVRLTLRSLNEKKLTRAWMMAQVGGATQRIRLESGRTDPSAWQLPADSPFAPVREEIRYEIFASDEDGLSIDPPIRGVVKRKQDRPPAGAVHAVHRVVLPTAAPVLEIRASDDYGIAQLALQLDIRRSQNDASGNSAANGDNPDTPRVAIEGTYPIRGEDLPWLRNHVLDLKPFRLSKGDRVELKLSVTDYRGQTGQGEAKSVSNSGVTVESEPLVLEISDENGVLSAISEADDKSERRLSEIIRQELGIGESK